jgi:hypothetical protein
MCWVPTFAINSSWTCVSTKVVVGVVNTFYAWSVLEIKVFSRPTPIWSGVKGIIINKNYNGLTLLLTTNDGVIIGSTITTLLQTMVF